MIRPRKWAARHLRTAFWHYWEADHDTLRRPSFFVIAPVLVDLPTLHADVAEALSQYHLLHCYTDHGAMLCS
jgi:hypothetical protein